MCASELRRPKGSRAVRRAVEALESEELFVSVLSIGEITKGIVALRRGKGKRDRETWLQHMQQYYAHRILPIGLETSQIWGELTAAAQKVGKMIPATDGLTATARRHGVRLDPWADEGS